LQKKIPHCRLISVEYPATYSVLFKAAKATGMVKQFDPGIWQQTY
jgi:hypothetical protein